MNERPTPETDALDRELHSPRVLQDRYSEMRDHARRLERERDEAREALAEEIKFHHRTHSELVQTQCQMQDVIRERDEALKLFISSKRARASLSKACDSLQKELRETKRERDEAREALEYIAHAGLSARHIEDYAKEFLRREEDAK